ncbi:MAG: NAAT family transporter [Thermoleophilia bacterium]|nr:NAAT family transporter [Thermoleophilia bacterium]
MDWKLLITTFITLVVIIDPVGNTPVFLILTRYEERGRRRFAVQAVLAAAAVIFFFAFFGRYILDYLGISVESLMVAGGILLGIVALDMMKGRLNAEEGLARGANVALVPLGTPLLGGPGAVVAAMLLMSQAETAAAKSLVSAGILGALVVVWVALTLAEQLVRLLKDTGVDLLTRVMGILLAAIAVEFVHQAVRTWVG